MLIMSSVGGHLLTRRNCCTQLHPESLMVPRSSPTPGKSETKIEHEQETWDEPEKRMQESHKRTGMKEKAATLEENDVQNCHHRFCNPHHVFRTDKKRSVEALWQDFFSNTSQWWDHRSEKVNPRFPDFKHKQTRESLWLGDPRNPPWVQTELAAIPPGKLQSNVFTWVQRLRRLVKAGQYKKTMDVFHQMQLERISPDSWTFLPVLNACARLGALEEGRDIHAQIIQVGCESDVYVANCLVDMYAKCGSIEDAWSMFNAMPEQDVITWNAMIGGYVKARQGLKALELFRKMQQKQVKPDSVTFIVVLNACASGANLDEGIRVHKQIIEVGCELDVYVATCLVDMYAKCGSINDACNVFNSMQEHNVVTWNAMIGGYAKSGQGLKAMELYKKMQQEGVEPDAVTFVGVINACASVALLEEGRRVHEQIIQRGCKINVHLATCLVDMYAKCGSIEDAWGVFSDMVHHNVVSWNALIGGYVKTGKGARAMELFREMQQEGVEPDAITFVGVLNACASVAALDEGRRVHEKIIRGNCESNIYVATCLIDMYAKCGSIEDASSVFDQMREHNVVTWNAMIGGYAKSGQALMAMQLFRKMQQERVEPDAITFVGVLNACASIAALEEGRRVHMEIIKVGCESDVYVATCLVDMYAKCRSMEDAWSIFHKMTKHDVVSWSALIGGYVECGQGLKAVELFRKMEQEGVEPNAVTFAGVLNACASVRALEEGRRVHTKIIQRDCESVYLGNCLVDMYAKCGSIEDAQIVFNNIGEHNVITWNTMIGAYMKSGQGLKAMELFQQMQQEEVQPNNVTFIGVLNACASIAALKEGRCIHTQVIQVGCESDVYVATGLVNMYAKCGSIGEAWDVFNKTGERDVIIWNAMIGGYVKSGQALQALELFLKMQQEGVEPNTITFITVLNACASVAALDQGRCIHAQIIQIGCESDVYVATCLVDMYAKCGSIEEAWGVFNKTQAHDVVIWNAMIVGCVKSGQGLKAIELFWELQKEEVEADAVTFIGVLNACASVEAFGQGRQLHTQIIELGWDSDVYVATCLIDMYAKCGSIEDAWDVFNKMQEHDVASWNAMIGGYSIHGQAKKAVALFRRMCREGVEINGITFTCLLSACSHGGLVNEGLRYFESMSSCFNVIPSTEHYTCMVDLLGRAARLSEAEELIKRVPCGTDVSWWISLLGACRIHGNIEIAERAAKRCWELDPSNASGYVLLSNMYYTSGKWDWMVLIQEEGLGRDC